MDDDRRTVQGVADGETLRTFLDRGPIIAFITDDSGRYVYVNRAMEQQFGNSAVAAFNDPQIVPPHEMIGAVPQPDGSAQYWKIVRFPFTGPAGTRFVGGVAVNVTDVRQAQARLAESERR